MSKGTDGNESQRVKRWTAKRKSAVVIDILNGKSTAAEMPAKHEEKSRNDGAVFLILPRRSYEPILGMQGPSAKWEAEKKNLCAKIGELTLDDEIIKKTEGVTASDRTRKRRFQYCKLHTFKPSRAQADWVSPEASCRARCSRQYSLLSVGACSMSYASMATSFSDR